MSLEDLGLEGCEIVDDVLLIDGDTIVYKQCCVFNEDDDFSRRKIAQYINMKVDELLKRSGCDLYIFFLTPSTNFRNHFVDDYKYSRDPAEKPVNLIWGKKWVMKNLNGHVVPYMEADDLIGTHMNEDSIIWSLDKDLRQIPGRHLDDETGKIHVVTEEGHLEERGKKVYFEGTIGLYLQVLTGDPTDYIIGCGIRKVGVYKSGAKKGETRIKREGVGPKDALEKLSIAVAFRGNKTPLEAALACVILEYKKLHGKDWQKHLEIQANLLFMVRVHEGDLIKRWTYDGRDEWMNIKTGEIT